MRRVVVTGIGIASPLGCDFTEASARLKANEHGITTMPEWDTLSHFSPRVAAPVTIPKARIEELDQSLMMFYTGTTRFASEIAAKVVANMGSKQQQLRQMRSMVDRAVEILNSDTDLTAFGELLHRSWLLKRELSSAISNSVVDGIYSTAIESGAIGGKLLGAGDAGFMIFFVPPEKQEDVRQALAQYLRVPFSFETEGSTIIHYDE